MIINLHITQYLWVLKKETDVIPDYFLQIYQTDLRSIFLHTSLMIVQCHGICTDYDKCQDNDIASEDPHCGYRITNYWQRNEKLRLSSFSCSKEKGFQIDCYYYFSLFLYRYSFEDWKVSNMMNTLLHFFRKNTSR